MPTTSRGFMAAAAGLAWTLPRRASRNALDLPRGSAYQPEDEEKYDGADEGDENRPTHSPHGTRDSEHGEQRASDEGPDNADNDVTDDAVSGATHHECRKNSCDETNYDPAQYSHGFCPREVVDFLRYGGQSFAISP